MDMFLDGGELDFEDQDVLEDQYISDFGMDEKPPNQANIAITDAQPSQ
jgi:hypothetical protein